jgi:hypothetical protein
MRNSAMAGSALVREIAIPEHVNVEITLSAHPTGVERAR